MNFIACLNPNVKLDTWNQFKHLKPGHQALVCLVSAVAFVLLLGYGGYVAFRALVQEFRIIETNGKDPLSQRADKVNKKVEPLLRPKKDDKDDKPVQQKNPRVYQTGKFAEEKKEKYDLAEFNHLFSQKAGKFANSKASLLIKEMLDRLAFCCSTSEILRAEFFQELDKQHLLSKDNPLFINGIAIKQAKDAFDQWQPSTVKKEPVVTQTTSKYDLEEFNKIFNEKAGPKFAYSKQSTAVKNLLKDIISQNPLTSSNDLCHRFYKVLDSRQKFGKRNPKFINGHTVKQAKAAFAQWQSAATVEKGKELNQEKKRRSKETFDLTEFNKIFDQKAGKFASSKDSTTAKQMLANFVGMKITYVELLRDKFFQGLDARNNLPKDHVHFINGQAVKQAKEAFDQWQPVPVAANPTATSAATSPGTYHLFNKKSDQIYQNLSTVRRESSYSNLKGIGGAVSVAYIIYSRDPTAKLGVMLAANSGLPGGAVTSSIHPNHLSLNYMHSLNSMLNAPTQEESVLAAALLSGVSLCSSEKEKQQFLKDKMALIVGKWGLKEPVGSSTDTMTIQGIDFTQSRDSDDYAHAHVVTDGFLLSPLQFNGKSKSIIPGKTFPVHQFIFADSVNANPEIGTPQGSVQRTLNQKAISDYDFFKDCVRKKLTASIDAMAEGGTTHALIAPLSLGIYAGDHKDKFNGEFFPMLQEILDEPVGPCGEKRGCYFAAVVFPTL